MNERNKKIMMMVCGAFAIFFTGYPHIWSIYQPYAMELTGWSKEQSSMCFYLSMAFFVFGNIAGGKLQDTYNPKVSVAIGGGIFAAGILLSAAALQPSPLMIYGTYGLMQGFGQGMIYTTIISTAQKWFPKHTGLASGIIVTANGLCGFFLAPISKMLLSAYGIKATFIVIGVFITISWILGCIFIVNPREEGVKEEKVYAAVQYTSVEMMKTKRFYFLLFTMMFGLISYLILSPLSQTIQIERGVAPGAAVAAVMLGSVCNALARLILPAIADKKGRIPCLRVVLLVSAVTMMILIWAPSYLSMAAIIIMYGCYGGIMGNFPSLTSSIFGIRYSGENYGYVMIGIVAATFLAPAITNVLGAGSYGMKGVFACGAVCALLSFISLCFLNRACKTGKRDGQTCK